MNVYQIAVKWLKENYTVQATGKELDFMRSKALSVHTCSECLERREPFAHLVAAILCSEKDRSLIESLAEGIPNSPPMSSYAWVHMNQLLGKWIPELEVVLNKKIE